jgi:hypothetical protein
MADLLTGLSLVSSLNRFVPALLVLFVVYGILGFTKAFGGNKNLHALISFLIAVLFVLSPRPTLMVAFMAPWFVVLFFFIIFVLMGFKILGVSDEGILKALANYRAIVWWILGFAIIIGLVGLSNVLGQKFLDERQGITSTDAQNFASPYDTVKANQTYTTGQVAPNSVSSQSFGNNVINTIFHKQVLGFILVALISTFSVYFMSQSYK